MTVALVGAAAIGVAGTVYASNKASKAAKKAGKRADAADERRMAWEQEQRDEWDATYGATEDRLAAYYDKLTPTLRITQGLEAFEKEKGIAMKNVQEQMAQRNIDRSGMSAELDSDVAINSAEARAKIRADAPMQVAKEQAGFLSVGLGKDPEAGMRAAMGGEQTRSASLERQTARNAGEATGAVIDSVTNLAQVGLNKYADYKAANPGTTNDPAVEGTGQ
jgi:hypothetical protein